MLFVNCALFGVFAGGFAVVELFCVFIGFDGYVRVLILGFVFIVADCSMFCCGFGLTLLVGYIAELVGCWGVGLVVDLVALFGM